MRYNTKNALQRYPRTYSPQRLFRRNHDAHLKLNLLRHRPKGSLLNDEKMVLKILECLIVAGSVQKAKIDAKFTSYIPQEHRWRGRCRAYPLALERLARHDWPATNGWTS